MTSVVPSSAPALRTRSWSVLLPMSHRTPQGRGEKGDGAGCGLHHMGTAVPAKSAASHDEQRAGGEERSVGCRSPRRTARAPRRLAGHRGAGPPTSPPDNHGSPRCRSPVRFVTGEHQRVAYTSSTADDRGGDGGVVRGRCGPSTKLRPRHHRVLVASGAGISRRPSSRAATWRPDPTGRWWRGRPRPHRPRPPQHRRGCGSVGRSTTRRPPTIRQRRPSRAPLSRGGTRGPTPVRPAGRARRCR